MTRQLLDSLLVHAEETRKVWDGKRADSDRWEEVETVVPCSETTAVVTIRKASNMRVVILAVWVNSQGGKWTHFFPTYEHLYGLKNERLNKTMDSVEEENASSVLHSQRHRGNAQNGPANHSDQMPQRTSARNQSTRDTRLAHPDLGHGDGALGT